MLEILSETKDPTRVQPHLRKCFEGIAKLRFQAGLPHVITGMVSAEGEIIGFDTHIKPADAQGSVEKWLVQVGAAGFGGKALGGWRLGPVVWGLHHLCESGSLAVWDF